MALEVPAAAHRTRAKREPLSREAVRREFWSAPDDTLFTREETAAVRGVSVSLLESEALAGDGIPFLKVKRRTLYRKADTLAFLYSKGRYIRSTSELQEVGAQ